MNAVAVTWSGSRDVVVSVGAVLVALGAIYRYAVRPVTRWAARVEKVISNVEEQLYPDHGSSLRDAVTQIQEHLGIETQMPDQRGERP